MGCANRAPSERGGRAACWPHVRTRPAVMRAPPDRAGCRRRRRHAAPGVLSDGLHRSSSPLVVLGLGPSASSMRLARLRALAARLGAVVGASHGRSACVARVLRLRSSDAPQRCQTRNCASHSAARSACHALARLRHFWPGVELLPPDRAMADRLRSDWSTLGCLVTHCARPWCWRAVELTPRARRSTASSGVVRPADPSRAEPSWPSGC